MKFCRINLALIMMMVVPNLAYAGWLTYDDFNDSSFAYSKWRVQQRFNIRGVGISEFEGHLNLLSSTEISTDFISSGANFISLQARQLPKEARGVRVKYSVSEYCAYNYGGPLFSSVPVQDHTKSMEFSVRTHSLSTKSTYFTEDLPERPGFPGYITRIVPAGFALLMDSADEANDDHSDDHVSGLYSWMNHPVNGMTRSFIANGGIYDKGFREPNGSYGATNIAKFTNKNISTTLLFSRPDKIRTWSNQFNYTQTFHRNPDMQDRDLEQGDLYISFKVIPTPHATENCSIKINQVDYYVP